MVSAILVRFEGDPSLSLSISIITVPAPLIDFRLAGLRCSWFARCFLSSLPEGAGVQENLGSIPIPNAGLGFHFLASVSVTFEASML